MGNKASLIFHPIDYYSLRPCYIYSFQITRDTKMYDMYHLLIEDPYMGPCTTYVRYYSSAIFAIVSFATYKYYKAELLGRHNGLK